MCIYIYIYIYIYRRRFDALFAANRIGASVREKAGTTMITMFAIATINIIIIIIVAIVSTTSIIIITIIQYCYTTCLTLLVYLAVVITQRLIDCSDCWNPLLWDPFTKARKKTR